MTKKKTFYERLGVDKTASSDEVTRAYREKARSGVHPDHGGDHDEMAALNEAYSCLRDPTRRLLYDKTGQSDFLPLADEVRSVLLSLFSAAAENDARDPVVCARNLLAQRRAEVASKHAQAIRQRSSLKAKRERVKSKSSINLFHLIIDQNLAAIEAGLSLLKRQEEVIAAALTELDNYETEPPPPQRYSLDYSLVFNTQTKGQI